MPSKCVYPKIFMYFQLPPGSQKPQLSQSSSLPLDNFHVAALCYQYKTSGISKTGNDETVTSAVEVTLKTPKYHADYCIQLHI